MDTLLDGVETSAEYVVQYSDGGYTTNLPLEDLLDGKAWVAFEYEGEPLEPEHGGPARMLVPAPLLLEEREVGPRAAPAGRRTSPASGRSTATTTTETHGGNSGTGATDLAVRPTSSTSIAETPRATTLAFDVPDWAGHRAGQHVDVRLTAEDGYQAQRSYSIASAPDGTRIELTVVQVEDGEVSPYLADELRPGDQIELRGPDRAATSSGSPSTADRCCSSAEARASRR